MTSPEVNFVFFMRRYDHQERLTAQEAMAHPYFAPVRAAEAEESNRMTGVMYSKSSRLSNSNRRRGLRKEVGRVPSGDGWSCACLCISKK